MQSLTLESATDTRPTVRTSKRPQLHVKAFTGGVIVLAFIVIGIAGPGLAPSDPNKQELTAMMTAPQGIGSAHVLGTDNLGRDILSRVIHGSRVSLLVAFAVVFVSGFVGITLGAISGYFGGKVDFVIQKLVEVIWAFPPLLLGITIMAFLGQGLFNLILALVAQRWIPYCRVVRGQTLSLRSRDFVIAARCLGASHRKIITRHILPNLIQTSLVIGTFAMASSIIAEASLSFLGVGVPPEIPTWGTMLADARIYISTAWWLPLFPGLCIFITVLGINLLGDALRDVLDPRLKRGGTGI
ncbi:MAG TPA: ABC transporter permease [Candidatus Binatia bacterium]|jgi:peptide/nickel transport system permease protein|nr:ABC transporter permease [Candidatus Binatia bacterium]